VPATESIAELLRVVKTNSSRWVHDEFPARKRFGWQTGYAAFTVSNSRMNHVKRYIAAQQEHHRKVSLQEEFRTFLRKHGLEPDARDLWG
jgi:putative transposase